jgi:Na+/citrate or Na+/malate symporter
MQIPNECKYIIRMIIGMIIGMIIRTIIGMIIGIEIGNMWRRYNQPTYQSYLK